MPLPLPKILRESPSSYKTKDRLLYMAYKALHFVAFILSSLIARLTSPFPEFYVPEIMIDFLCPNVPYCIKTLHELFAQCLFHLVNFCLFFKTPFMIGGGCFIRSGIAFLIRRHLSQDLKRVRKQAKHVSGRKKSIPGRRDNCNTPRQERAWHEQAIASSPL